jgi:hypothetical protein
MPPVGFEPTISAGEQPLGPAVTDITKSNFGMYSGKNGARGGTVG